MSDPSASSDPALEKAARRLERAMAMLERAVERTLPAAHAATLASELELARARERALEAVAAEASRALGRAADEVRAALAAEA